MYYCFLHEDLDGLTLNPLLLQMEYARRLNSLCIGSLKEGSIRDGQGKEICPIGETVMLRCSTDYFISGVQWLRNKGIKPAETEEDAEQIENWYRLGLTRRTIFEFKADYLKENLLRNFRPGDKVFLKSRTKGFSAVLDPGKISELDLKAAGLLKDPAEKLIACRYFPMKSDSLGIRESRHVVFQHHRLNSSRRLHSVRHTVPGSHIERAEAIVEQLTAVKGFPDSYVLDLGEFIEEDGIPHLDIVELNPISCSMCFVNNSVFDTAVPEIRKNFRQLGMGYEYCYDFLSHPERYALNRVANKNYGYEAEGMYSFL